MKQPEVGVNPDYSVPATMHTSPTRKRENTSADVAYVVDLQQAIPALKQILANQRIRKSSPGIWQAAAELIKRIKPAT
jgi:hypothetical protein